MGQTFADAFVTSQLPGVKLPLQVKSSSVSGGDKPSVVEIGTIFATGFTFCYRGTAAVLSWRGGVTPVNKMRRASP